MYSIFFRSLLISWSTLQDVAGRIYGTLPAHTSRQLSTGRGRAVRIYLGDEKTKNHQDDDGGAECSKDGWSER